MKFVSSVLALSAILPIFLANASPLQERQPQDGEEPIPTEANIAICTGTNGEGECKDMALEFNTDKYFTECIELTDSIFFNSVASFYVKPGAYCRTFSEPRCVYRSQTAFVFPPGEDDLKESGAAQTIASFRCQICTACT